MQIKSMTLAKGILSVAAVSLLTGCVDDKYDLSDIDTTSRFTVDNLTVPINLETLQLKNVIDIDDDDETIKIENVDGKDIYTIKKRGNIDPTTFNLDPITVTPDNIEGVNINITNLPTGIKLPSLKQTFDLDLSNGLKKYNFILKDIDKTLKSIDQVKTSTISINVTLSVPTGVVSATNKINFKDLKLVLPKELIGVTCENGTFNESTHTLTISDIPVETNGVANLVITANGLELGEEGVIGESHKLEISGMIGLEEAKIDFNVADVTLPSPFTIKINYSVSQFDVEKFSGVIDYEMDDIKIDPISLSDLPDFLNNPKTNVIIDNPVIYVSIKNPVGDYGLNGHGRINLVSNFTNENQTVSETHSGAFELTGKESKIAFCSNSAFKPTGDYADYTTVVINGLDKILTNGEDGLPKTISVSVTDLKFDGTIEDLPLGDLGAASGEYNFYAPFAFGKGSVIYYNTTENGWSSDDLDDVNITLLKLHALVTSKLPVDIELKVQPIDKNGNEIAVEEVTPFHVPANCTNELATLTITGKNGQPIKDFDGVIFEATISQNSDNAEALGPDIELELNDLRITVNGYYETDF